MKDINKAKDKVKFLLQIEVERRDGNIPWTKNSLRERLKFKKIESKKNFLSWQFKKCWAGIWQKMVD